MDMIVATAPVLLIRKLNTSRTTKLDLCLMMGGGWLYVCISLPTRAESPTHSLVAIRTFSAAAATIVKIYYFKGLPDHADITLSWSPITLWYT